MTVLSADTILENHMSHGRQPIFYPFESERIVHPETGLSYGLSGCMYDVRLDQDVLLPPGAFALASTMEHFCIPDDVVAIVHDKSSLARQGLAVQNTVADPGWRGYLTLELSNNHPPLDPPIYTMLRSSITRPSRETVKIIEDFDSERTAYNAKHTLRLVRGQPIAQVILHRLDRPTSRLYAGKYQDQERGPQEARGAEAETRDHPNCRCTPEPIVPRRATQRRWVNFYPPCDDLYGHHPWRTTSWVSRELALKHVRAGCIAPAVPVDF